MCQVYVCDSMGGKLNRVTQKCASALYKFCTNQFGKLELSHLPVQKQMDGNNCELFAVAFAAEVVHGLSPTNATFVVKEIRLLLINCLGTQQLKTLPKVEWGPECDGNISVE